MSLLLPTAAPALSHRYLHGPAVDMILADEKIEGGVLWPLTDHLGSVRDLVDSSGDLQNHLVYDSFGNITSESNDAVDHIFGYTGRERDEESHLNYYRARYYDPEAGRFISNDPIGFSAGDANLYRYVGNQPTTFTDPSGLEGMTISVPPTVPRRGAKGVQPNEPGTLVPQFLELTDINGNKWSISAKAYYQYIGNMGFSSGGASYLSNFDIVPKFRPNMDKLNPNCNKIRLAAVWTDVTRHLPNYIVPVNGRNWQFWGLPALVRNHDDLFSSLPPTDAEVRTDPGRDSTGRSPVTGNFYNPAYKNLDEWIRASKLNTVASQPISRLYILGAYCDETGFFSYAVIHTRQIPVPDTGYYNLEIGLRQPTPSNATFDKVYEDAIRKLKRGIRK